MPMTDTIERGAHRLAADLGGTQLRTAVVAADGQIVVKEAVATHPEDGPDAVIERLVRGLESVRDAVPLEVRRSIWVGVVAGPGPLSPASGQLIDPILPFDRRFDRLPLASIVAERLDMPILLERDTVAALLGERAFGAAKRSRDCVYVVISTGVGAAVMSAGKVLEGPDGLAGELGHVTVSEANDLCPCGARGHLEAIAGGYAIGRVAELEVVAGRSPALAAIKRREGGRPLTAADVAEAATRGDKVAIAIQLRARNAVAAAVSGYVNAFNPSLVVLGGSIARGGGSAYLEAIRSAVDGSSFPTAARRVSIVTATLGDDAGLVGAVPIAMLRSGRRAR